MYQSLEEIHLQPLPPKDSCGEFGETFGSEAVIVPDDDALLSRARNGLEGVSSQSLRRLHANSMSNKLPIASSTVRTWRITRQFMKAVPACILALNPAVPNWILVEKRAESSSYDSEAWRASTSARVSGSRLSGGVRVSPSGVLGG